MTSESATLVLRFADVGVATYATLRVVGQPAQTVAWVLDHLPLQRLLDALAHALPEPRGLETAYDAIERALTRGALVDPAAERALAGALGAQLLPAAAWRLLTDVAANSGAVLFVSPTSRLSTVPWALVAVAGDGGPRLAELVDVLFAAPSNIVHTQRSRVTWSVRCERPPLLILDPRVPNQRPDSPLGSVLGRPSPQTPLARHFDQLLSRRTVAPDVTTAVELFRRTDLDRRRLSDSLRREPSRLLYVGHATAADGDAGHAERAAIHVADQRPLTAADLMSSNWPMPPRVGLLACASGGDYRFDEATGLVAALILAGAQIVTATLWSLPTTAGYRRFAPGGVDGAPDPMGEAIIGVDRAHEAADAGRAVNAWQRAAIRRWRRGDESANPLYWAGIVTFAVDGAR